MELHVIDKSLLDIGFKYIGDSVHNKHTYKKNRGTHSICMEVHYDNVDNSGLVVTNIFKSIEDTKTGITFAKHSVFVNGGLHFPTKPEELTALAFSITAEAFSSVLDKGGRPYFEHCLSVARKLGPNVNDAYKQVAIMHDLLEDIEHYRTSVLEDLGFSHEVYMSVYYLSKLNTRPEILTNGVIDMQKYYGIIMSYRICTFVKMSDIQNNSDLRRLKGTTEKDYARNMQYSKYFASLKQNAIKQGWMV